MELGVKAFYFDKGSCYTTNVSSNFAIIDMKKALLFAMSALASTAFATIVPYGEAPEQTGDLLLPDGGVRPWTPKLLLLH